MFPVVVPRLGWTMEEGTFVEWQRRDGDVVQAGDALFVLEGEKAAQEIEAAEPGTLRIAPHGPQPGEIVKVGRVLGCLLQPGETPDWMNAGNSLPPATSTASAISTPRPTAFSAPPRAGLRAQRIREDHAPSPSAAVAASGATHVATIAKNSDRVNAENAPTISPRARRVAKELGIDWSVLQGSGSSGRIRECDVRAAASPSSTTHTPVAGEAGDQFRPWSPMRRVITERLSFSARTTVPVTLTTTVDATNLVNLREQFRSAGQQGETPSYTDLLVKLVASALQRHPELNSRGSETGLTLCSGIHIGLAVDTAAGLLVPVIRDVPSLSLRALTSKTRQLIELARSGKLQANDLTGGTFTVTNLGMHGIDSFTPVINPPECAILGIGRLRREPAVVGDRIEPREQLSLSLTFDHRFVDGAPAAKFLDALRLTAEAPAAALLG